MRSRHRERRTETVGGASLLHVALPRCTRGRQSISLSLILALLVEHAADREAKLLGRFGSVWDLCSGEQILSSWSS